jgi:hypothetical protein
MEISYIAHWLVYALIGWTLMSIAAAPLIGRFLRGHLKDPSRLPMRAANDEQVIFAAHNVTVLPIAASHRKA